MRNIQKCLLPTQYTTFFAHKLASLPFSPFSLLACKTERSSHEIRADMGIVLNTVNSL